MKGNKDKKVSKGGARTWLGAWALTLESCWLDSRVFGDITKGQFLPKRRKKLLEDIVKVNFKCCMSCIFI